MSVTSTHVIISVLLGHDYISKELLFFFISATFFVIFIFPYISLIRAWRLSGDKYSPLRKAWVVIATAALLGALCIAVITLYL